MYRDLPPHRQQIAKPNKPTCTKIFKHMSSPNGVPYVPSWGVCCVLASSRLSWFIYPERSCVIVGLLLGQSAVSVTRGEDLRWAASMESERQARPRQARQAGHMLPAASPWLPSVDLQPPSCVAICLKKSFWPQQIKETESESNVPRENGDPSKMCINIQALSDVTPCWRGKYLPSCFTITRKVSPRHTWNTKLNSIFVTYEL
jgi:hypothetical protein